MEALQEEAHTARRESRSDLSYMLSKSQTLRGLTSAQVNELRALLAERELIRSGVPDTEARALAELGEIDVEASDLTRTNNANADDDLDDIGYDNPKPRTSEDQWDDQIDGLDGNRDE